MLCVSTLAMPTPKIMIIRSYTELMRLNTFDERYDYLHLAGSVGVVTFGFDRYLNQIFYNSKEWRIFRNRIIVRDGACDLAIPGQDIFDGIRIHHMNPITLAQVEAGDPDILNPEFVICTSLDTHNAIHFGSSLNLKRLPLERRKGDTTLW